jgi:hypothetical protein
MWRERRRAPLIPEDPEVPTIEQSSLSCATIQRTGRLPLIIPAPRAFLPQTRRRGLACRHAGSWNLRLRDACRARPKWLVLAASGVSRP